MTTDVHIENDVKQEAPNREESARQYVLPRADIYQNAKDIVLVADVPGVDGPGVSVSVEDHHLVIEADSASTAPANSRLIRQEFRQAPYRRVFKLAGDVHEDGIQASVKNGVLTVRIPTTDPGKTKRIRVEQVPS